jgi:hypothetical protein
MQHGRFRSDVVADAIRRFVDAISCVNSANLEHAAASRPTGDRFKP